VQICHRVLKVNWIFQQMNLKTIGMWVTIMYQIWSTGGFEETMQISLWDNFLWCSCLIFRHSYCKGLRSAGARLGQHVMPIPLRPIAILILGYVVLMMCFHPCQTFSVDYWLELILSYIRRLLPWKMDVLSFSFYAIWVRFTFQFPIL